MLIDLHVHDDGDLAALFARAQAVGIDGLGFTLDRQLNGLEAVRNAAAGQSVQAYCGCRVSTNRGELLCYFPNLEALGDEGDWLGEVEAGKLPSIEKVIAEVESRAGVAIAAHPYYKNLPAPMGDHIFSIKGLHACEVASPLTTGMQRDLAIEAAESMNLPSVGGSSGHNADDLGVAMTYFISDIDDEAALVAAIRAQKCYAVMSFAHLPEDARPSAPAKPRGPYNGRRGRRPRRQGKR